MWVRVRLPRRLFTPAEKVVELVERGGGITDQESRLMLDEGIAKGRGGVFQFIPNERQARLCQ